jgi:dethiobiotin synthetase
LRRASGIFITGTDTGVGKTVVAAGLALALRERGLKVGVMKPVATGCLGDGKRLISSDAVFLLEAAENEYPALTNPFRFKNPLAPNVASVVEKKEIPIEKILKAYRELRCHYDYVIVEGIGGLLVPITKDYFVANLIHEFNLPVLIVARGGLGTINHTLLTVDAATIRGFEVRGVIFNRMPKVNLSMAEITNPKVIHDLTGVPILGTLPEMEDVDVERCRFGSLREVFKERIDFDRILGLQVVS